MLDTKENTTNLLDDLKNITETLLTDKDGERARAFMAYFDNCSAESKQKMVQCEDFNERKLFELMGEAYEASSVIVSKTWSAMHSASLN